jgi:hypothetical protein
MHLPQSQRATLANALASLGYESLTIDVDSALCDMEEALDRVDKGDEAKVVRFELYKRWAMRAGCKWGSRKAETRFNVHGTDLHTIVKQLLPDEGVENVSGAVDCSTGLKFLET